MTSPTKKYKIENLPNSFWCNQLDFENLERVWTAP